MRIFYGLLVSLLLVLAAFESCKKGGFTEAQNVSGNWNWVASYNDGAPGPTNPLTPANTGTKQSLNFINNNWELTKNNAVVLSGTYNTSPAKNTYGQPINRIDFYSSSGPADSATYYLINADTLTFSYDFSGTAGSGATIYVRK